MNKFQKFIQESPDRITKDVHHQTADAFPFGFFHGKFYFDKRMNGKTHYEMLEKFLMNGDKHIATQVVKKNNVLDSTDMKFHGRFWLTKKIISFWDYPDRTNFEKVVSELKKTGIKIDSSWKVEVSDGKFVPIDEYKSGIGHKISQIDHIMDPISKNIIKQAGKGVTMMTKKNDLPKGMSFAEYRAKTLQSESLDESSIYYKLGSLSHRRGEKKSNPYTESNDNEKYNEWEKGYIASEKKISEDASTVAPTSVSNGQHQEKIGSVEKRKDLDDEDDLKTKIKKKIKKKLDETSGGGHGPSSTAPSSSGDGHFAVTSAPTSNMKVGSTSNIKSSSNKLDYDSEGDWEAEEKEAEKVRQKNVGVFKQFMDKVVAKGKENAK